MSQATERYTRVSELFQTAAELPPEERAAFFARECGEDESLRREIELLLDADASAEGFIEESISAIPADLLTEEEFAGRHFGPYEVIREIGRGGLGAVYLAVRSDGAYRKEVALKLIRRGLDTDDILRRFRNERQILAQLDHPNIARLLDGGTSDDGQPYFVMDYVKGEPFIACCDSQQLGTQQRLELFRKVCAAVTYAHQNLVIHRDLKPSNILVTPEGEPKLLDFGIAKLLSAEDEMMFTQTAPGQRAMTPDYASPEQIKGEKITTASDVYSLGVLLYELLSGARPYRVTTRTSEEISRAVLEQTPERPSANQKSLPGDLDNIVLMAMRKEPERRYASAAELADDIRRHQEGLPVEARPNTFSYRAGKFIKRHRAGVTAGALILLAIIGGLVATLWQTRIAQAERTKAERRFNDVRKLANSNLFEVYPEIENLQGSLKARETILRNALAYLDSLAHEAEGDSQLQSELATAYEKVGDVQGALNTSSLGNIRAGLESYAKARKLRAAVLARMPNAIEAKDSLANNHYVTARTLWNNNQTKEAEAAFEEGLKLRRELVVAKPDSVEFGNRLAVLLIDYGAIPVFNFQSAKALILFNEALEINAKLRQRDPGNPDLKKARARGLRVLSKAKGGFGDFAGGLDVLREALAISTDLAREFPQDFRLQRSVWLTETMRCELLIDQGDGAEAVASCLPTIEFPKIALQNEPENGVVGYDLAISHFNTARAFGLAQNPAQAIEQAQKAVEVMAGLSAKSPDNLEYKRNLAIYRTTMGRAQIELGRFDDAISVLQNVRETLRPIVEADLSNTTYQYDLGMAARLAAQALHRKGESAQAVELATEASSIFAKLRALNALRDSDKNVLAELERENAEYRKSL